MPCVGAGIACMSRHSQAAWYDLHLTIKWKSRGRKTLHSASAQRIIFESTLVCTAPLVEQSGECTAHDGTHPWPPKNINTQEPKLSLMHANIDTWWSQAFFLPYVRTVGYYGTDIHASRHAYITSIISYMHSFMTGKALNQQFTALNAHVRTCPRASTQLHNIT